MKRWIHAATDYDSVAIAQASERCEQIRDIIMGTVELSGRGSSANGEQCFDAISKGHDANIVEAAYGVLSSMYDLTQKKIDNQVRSQDVVCLVFAEITPDGEVITNDIGLLDFYSTIAEYTAEYANSQNVIKTLYCNLSMVAIHLWSSNTHLLDGIVPGTIDQLLDIFGSLGYVCDVMYGGLGIEIATSKNNLFNNKAIELTLDPIRAKKLPECMLIPSQYFDVVNQTLNIPQSFIDEVCNSVDNLFKGWQPESFWVSIDPESSKMDKAWKKYLKKPESKVNEKLKVLPEPSIQGNLGYMFINDTSGNRDWETEPKVSYVDWVENEIDMASKSGSPSQYAKEYERYLKSLINE